MRTTKRLNGKLIMAAGVGLISIQFILFTIGYYVLQQNKKFEVSKEDTYTVIQQAEKLLNLITDAETGQRGFILTGNKEFLTPYYDALGKTDLSIKELKKLTIDSSTEQLRLGMLSRLINRKYKILGTGITYRMNGRIDKAAEATKSGVGKAVMDSIKTVMASFQLEEHRLMKLRGDKANRSMNYTFIILWSGTMFVMICVIILFLILYHENKHRKIAQKELYISREQYSKTIQSMGDGVITTDTKGAVTFMNNVAEELTGWVRSEAAGKPLEEIFNITNEFTGQPVANPVRRALNEDKIVKLTNHTILSRRDGSRVFIDDSAAPIHNNEREVIGAVLVFSDVTEQTTARKKLIESERTLSGIVNNTRAIIYIKDTEGRYLLVNNRFKEVMGVREEDVIGKTDTDLLPGDMAYRTRLDSVQVIKEKKELEFEEDIQRPGKPRRVYLVSKFPLCDNEDRVYAVCGIATDITERKKAEELTAQMNSKLEELVKKKTAEVFESEKRFHSALDSMIEGVQIISREWRYLYVNPAVARQGKYSVEELTGNTMMEMYPGIENTPLFEKMNDCMTNRIPYHIENNFKFPDGSKGWFDLSIQPSPDGIFVLSVDVTERKRSEQETLDMLEKVQQRNKELRQFAYIVSHNLRAPIAKIQGLTLHIKDGAGKWIEEQTGVSMYELIHDEVNNLDSVIKDLNTIIAARETEDIKSEYTDLSEQLKLVMQVLDKEISESKAHFNIDFSRVKGFTTVKSYLYSILYNLISNAIKYRSPERLLQISIQSDEDEKYYRLNVKDNGSGIDMEGNGEKVFGLYKRFHPSIPGKGVGLSLVRTQAQSLGGDATVESKVNEGTTFKIFFKKQNQ